MLDVINLYSLAEAHDIRIDDIETGEPSLSIRLDDKCCIAIDSKMLDTEAKMLVALAHETGHCETLSFYNVKNYLDVWAKHERRAWIWAIKKLIPEDELHTAVCDGNYEMWQLADYFDLPQEFVEMAVNYYEGIE